MSTGILLTGIIMVIVLVAPFILANRFKKNKNKKEKDIFKNLAQKNGVQISDPDVNNGLILGLDENAKKLCVSHFKNLENRFKALDLTDFRSCEVLVGQVGQSQLQKLELVLKGNEKSEALLFFQDSNLDMPKVNFNDSREKANTWKSKIKPLLG